MQKFAEYFPQFKGFGIADSELKKAESLPLFMLSPGDYSVNSDDDAVVIGVLLGREPEHYCLQEDYVQALCMAGAKIMFLDYEHHLLQLSLCDGLLLPGGAFTTPEWYYSDAKNDSGSDDYPCARSRAYAECLFYALSHNMPVLGICAGMQVIAAEHSLKLYRSPEYFESPLHHKCDLPVAHHIDLMEGTPFRKLMSDMWRLPVNSRHNEVVAPVRVQRELLGLSENQELPLEIYACATDGIPEAIGNMEAGILAVQWHPENLAAKGDEMQLRIFKWLVDAAAERKRNK